MSGMSDVDKMQFILCNKSMMLKIKWQSFNYFSVIVIY